MLIIPPRRRGVMFGGLLVFGTLFLDTFWFWQVTNWPVTFITFIQSLLLLLSLPWLGLLIYRLYGLISLRYHLDRNRLFIRQGAMWQVIPLSKIERVEVGLQLVSPSSYRGAWWPGYWAGRGKVTGAGLTLFYATTRSSRQVILVTPALAYAISPPDPGVFVRELELRRAMEVTQELEQITHRPAFTRWAFWSDQIAQGLLALGALATMILFGRLCWHYPSLPARLALHFNAQGHIDRIGQRSDLFALPIIGLFILAVNLVLGFLLYRWERVGAYLIWGSIVAVDMLLWLALGQLVG